MHRQWAELRGQYYADRRHSRRNGCKKRVWTQYRYPKTTQERKMHFDDPEAVEMGIRIRLSPSRNDANLPQLWDEWRCHGDKSWKTQSKRKHQWK